MRHPIFLALVLTASMVAQPLSAATYNPDNGHSYEAVYSYTTWQQAKAAAESRGGHLVTVTSGDEKNFLVSNGLAPHRYWIGGVQDAAGPEKDGGWGWVTGEPWSYTNWGTGEPNDSGNEDCAQWWNTPALGTWNDRACSGFENGYVVEYEDAKALFKVTKTFSDLNEAEVEVTLSCNTGLPLEQTATITGGDSEGVTFTVKDLPGADADCEIRESGGPDGYTVAYNAGQGCEWSDLAPGYYVCFISNTADDATYTVVKDWVFERDGGLPVTAEADVTIICDRPIDGGEHDGFWYLSGTLGDGDKLVATVDVSQGAAWCSASERNSQSAVESTRSDCDDTRLGPGGSHTCTITNTVFYEGVPTLSQFGLAILVLLTLGVGFVGLRRFA